MIVGKNLGGYLSLLATSGVEECFFLSTAATTNAVCTELIRIAQSHVTRRKLNNSVSGITKVHSECIVESRNN